MEHSRHMPPGNLRPFAGDPASTQYGSELVGLAAVDHPVDEILPGKAYSWPTRIAGISP